MIICPWCSKSFESTGDGRCPHCGAIPPSGEKQQVQEQPGPEPGQQQEPQQQPDRDFGQVPPSIFDLLLGPEGYGLPWEHRSRFGTWPALWATLKTVLFAPLRAFRVMQRNAGYRDPLLYALIVGGISMALAAVISSGAAARTPGSPPDAPRRILIWGLSSAPFLALALPALAALGARLCLSFLGYRNTSFQTTFRVFCYALASSAALATLPCCGYVLFLGWYLATASCGLWLVHKTGPLQAAACVLLPLSTLLLLISLLAASLGNWPG